MIDPAEEAIRAGERAEAILEDEVFRAAVAGVREDIMVAWRDTAPHDTAIREEAWRSLNLVDAVVSKLRVAVNNAAVEAMRLEAERRERGG